jgi:hypothetical protein
MKKHKNHMKRVKKQSGSDKSERKKSVEKEKQLKQPFFHSFIHLCNRCLTVVIWMSLVRRPKTAEVENTLCTWGRWKFILYVN